MFNVLLKLLNVKCGTIETWKFEALAPPPSFQIIKTSSAASHDAQNISCPSVPTHIIVSTHSLMETLSSKYYYL